MPSLCRSSSFCIRSVYTCAPTPVAPSAPLATQFSSYWSAATRAWGGVVEWWGGEANGNGLPVAGVVLASANVHLVG